MQEEITKLMGKVGDIMITEVEKGAIRKFADAVDDHNPLYWDEEYAKNSRHGCIIAPPGFFGWPTKWIGAKPTFPTFAKLFDEAATTFAQIGYDRNVDGGIEYEFFHTVRAGDTLAALPRITNVSEREGKSGKLIFVSVETTYTNQNGDLVAKARQTSIYR